MTAPVSPVSTNPISLGSLSTTPASSNASSNASSTQPISSVQGLASGIQWQDLISQIIQNETAQDLTPITNQQSADKTAATAWQSFGTVMGSLRDAANALATPATLAGETATVSQSPSGRTLLSATATSSAAPGTYSIQ